MKIQEEILKYIDVQYSYRLAKKMEQFYSNEALGFRTAGSKAEFDTGEMLKKEMEDIGLSDVKKEAVTVDGWEFKKAVLCFTGKNGEKEQIQLGAYQTNFVTQGFQEFSLVYIGRGTEEDYRGRDVKGKLVLADINQRDEWWINYPVYQAYLKGAAGLLAVQVGGYGEIDHKALNAQDIAGPEYAPGFSISRKDAEELKEILQDQKEIKVYLDADSQVKRNCTTYNITGCIPGKHPERIVLMSAHYDSYFSGFQDDNTAVSMMLGIARALKKSKFQFHNTIIICAMAAEEWGVADSNFDWSTGAYEQVFHVHPEWAGQVIADLNFELPALAHGTRARIRSCYEYTEYLEEFLSKLPVLAQAYPEETKVTAPIETWSDDFSMAIAGIPSMVNDFTGGSFMETHYHSQFDNDCYYDEKVYLLHHQLFALLIEALDRTAVAPLCFSPVMERAARALENKKDLIELGLYEKSEKLSALLEQGEETAKEEYRLIAQYNSRYSSLLEKGRTEEAEELFLKSRETEKRILEKFKKEQDIFVRIDWYGNVLYSHEILLKNIQLLKGAAENLEEGKLSEGLRKLYQVDNNAYAFMFDKEVYSHFTEYVLNQPEDRLKWGYKRLMEHENLYDLVKNLLKKQRAEKPDFKEETDYLKYVCARQKGLFLKTIEKLCKEVENTFLDLAVKDKIQ